MELRPEEQLRRWLAAEEASLPDDADEAFMAVFRLVPKRAPRAGFAERVMLAASPARAHVPGLLTTWWARALVSAGLVSTGVAALLLSPASSFGAAISWVTGGVTIGAQAFTCFVGWADRGLATWNVLSSLAHATALAVATPAVGAIVAANVFLALASFIALERLLGSREELL